MQHQGGGCSLGHRDGAAGHGVDVPETCTRERGFHSARAGQRAGAAEVVVFPHPQAPPGEWGDTCGPPSVGCSSLVRGVRPPLSK